MWYGGVWSLWLAWQLLERENDEHVTQPALDTFLEGERTFRIPDLLPKCSTIRTFFLERQLVWQGHRIIQLVVGGMGAICCNRKLSNQNIYVSEYEEQDGQLRRVMLSNFVFPAMFIHGRQQPFTSFTCLRRECSKAKCRRLVTQHNCQRPRESLPVNSELTI